MWGVLHYPQYGRETVFFNEQLISFLMLNVSHFKNVKAESTHRHENSANGKFSNFFEPISDTPFRKMCSVGIAMARKIYDPIDYIPASLCAQRHTPCQTNDMSV